jgi:hypothetical protein
MVNRKSYSVYRMSYCVKRGANCVAVPDFGELSRAATAKQPPAESGAKYEILRRADVI